VDDRPLSTFGETLTGRLTETNKQLVKFVFIGGFAVLTDLAFYYLFLNILPERAFGGWVENEALAKSLSFLCGLSVTYQFNKRWTWRRKDRSNRRLVKFLMLYGVSLVLNVSLNTFFLYELHENALLEAVPFKYFVAFVGATGICAASTFVGQKFWIFRQPAPPFQ
jgi:putative flippase GtrA